MFCKYCGYKNDDNSNFCLQCGNKLERPQEATPIPGIPNGQQQYTAPLPGAPNGLQQYTAPLPGAPNGQQQYTAPLPGAPYVQPQSSGPTPSDSPLSVPKKSRKRLLFLLIPIVILVAVSIIAGILLLRPNKSPVLDHILDALQGTIEADSVAFDLTYHSKTEDFGNNSLRAEGVLEYDLDKGILNFDITRDKNTEYIIYDKVSYYIEEGELQYTYNAEEDLDMIFDYYNEYKSGLDAPDEVNWEDIIDEADLSSIINGDKMKDCIATLRMKLNDKDFYKEICKEFKATTKNKETTYYFDLDVPKALNSVIDIMEPSLMEGADDMKDFIAGPSEVITALTMEISIEDNRITSVEFNISFKPGDEAEQRITLKLQLEDYNKVSVDASKLRNYRNEDSIREESTEILPDAVTNATEPSPTEAPIVDTLEAADLELWYVSSENDPLIEDNINRFMNDNPQCNVNLTYLSYSDYFDRLKLYMVAGVIPDIFMTSADYLFYDLIKEGFICDITDYMEHNNYKERFLEGAIAQSTYGDRVYAVPVGGITDYGFYYNKEIFNEYGLSEPTTLEELERVCDSLLANGITPFELGDSEGFYDSIYFSCLAARKSGVAPFLEALEGNSYALEDGFLYAGNKIQEWVEKGYFNPDYASINDYDARNNLNNGNGAMYLNGSWSINTILSENSDFYSNMGYFEFPAYNAGDANSQIALGSFGYSFYSVSSSCANPKAAFEAITYLMDDVAVEQYISNGTLVPIKNYVPVNELEQEIMEAAGHATNVHQLYNTYLPYAASNECYNGIRNIFSLYQSTQEVFDAIANFIPAD